MAASKLIQTVYLYQLHVPEIKDLGEFATFSKCLCSRKYYGIIYDPESKVRRIYYGNLELNDTGMSITNLIADEYTCISPEHIYSTEPNFKDQVPWLSLEFYNIQAHTLLIGDRIITEENLYNNIVLSLPVPIDESHVTIDMLYDEAVLHKIYNLDVPLTILRITEFGG